MFCAVVSMVLRPLHELHVLVPCVVAADNDKYIPSALVGCENVGAGGGERVNCMRP